MLKILWLFELSYIYLCCKKCIRYVNFEFRSDCTGKLLYFGISMYGRIAMDCTAKSQKYANNNIGSSLLSVNICISCKAHDRCSDCLLD